MRVHTHRFLLIFTTFVMMACASKNHRPSLVMMTDFGEMDGAVSEMKGVAYGIDSNLTISDLTHLISPYNIWEGAYRLGQTMPYWPTGTVFVGVVDPGVGSERKSIVAKLKSGHYFVGPDNGLLTFVDDSIGIEAVRVIDETKHRRRGSEESNTFHGRDVFTFAASKLASGKTSFENIGPALGQSIIKLNYQKPLFEKNSLHGNIPALDPNYGNVWTNIPAALLEQHFKGIKMFHVEIFQDKKRIYSGKLPMTKTFSDVREGSPLMYINSLMNVSFALNMGNFSQRYKVDAGAQWHATLTPSN
jgi:S-adenosylmethionine hydrolase